MAIKSTDGFQGPQERAVNNGTVADKFINLPKELITEILSSLFPLDACRARLVCRKFKEVVDEISYDSTMRFFGPDEWRKLGLEIEGELPPPPQNSSLFTSWVRSRIAEKKEASTCSVIFMPKGLSLNKIIALVKNRGLDDTFKFLISNEDLDDHLIGEIPNDKAYWYLITNHIIEGSRNIPYPAQKELINEKTKGKCVDPSYLEVVVCCLMNYIRSKEFLFGLKPICTTSRVRGFLNNYRMAVGGFYDGCIYLMKLRGDDDVHSRIGIAACRRFLQVQGVRRDEQTFLETLIP